MPGREQPQYPADRQAEEDDHNQRGVPTSDDPVDEDRLEVEEGEEDGKPAQDDASDQLALTATATCPWFW